MSVAALAESSKIELSPIIAEGDTINPWAFKQYLDKYAWKDDDGEPTEVWPDTAYRVVRHVLGALGYTDHDEEFQTLLRMITQRKFIPAGRYLASSGRRYHQVNNCILYRCEDSREGWADLVRKAILSLSSGGGVGVVYSDVRPNGRIIKKTGGIATGPLSPAQMVNEVARHVMAGGQRRSALWAGLHWDHPDIFDYIHIKDWSDEIKAAKEADFSSPAPLDMTNISVILNSEFFFAYQNAKHPKHDWARKVYWETITKMVATGEPGFSVDVGQNANECLRNPCITKDNYVLTNKGYKIVDDLINNPHTIWTGKQWAKNVVFEKTRSNVPILNIKLSNGRSIRCDHTHEFFVERWHGAGKKRRKLQKIVKVPASELRPEDIIHNPLPQTNLKSNNINFDREGYTLGWLYGDGSFSKSGGADLTLCSEESKKCVDLLTGYNSINENDKRGYTRLYFSVNSDFSTRSKDVFPNDIHNQSDGFITSFIAGLWDADGNFNQNQYAIRLSNKSTKFLFGVARTLEYFGIYGTVSKNGKDGRNEKQQYQYVVSKESVNRFLEIIPTRRCSMQVNNDYEPYRKYQLKVDSISPDGVEDVYCANVGVDEHSFMCEGAIIANCCEITSEDDSDVCNLGSINLARIKDKQELEEVVKYAILFLLGGTVYSDVPHEEIRVTRERNRRLGLGMMGVHEWLLKKGSKYEVTPEFREWLSVYRDTADRWAEEWAKKHSLSTPKKNRACAPTGTIGLIGETTTSAEPIFSVAYKRRFLDTDQKWKYQYVIDPTAERLIEEGVDPDNIEDAYTLAYNVEKRIKFQADMQDYIDHAISSTINLPYPITKEDEIHDFGETLFKYLPRLRGITVYPNGARAGQIMESVPYSVAKGKTGVTREEDREAACKSGVCGI